MGIIVRQSIKATIVNYIGVGIGFVTTFFVLTRYLTTEEIGLTRVLIDTATMLAGLAQLGTNASVLRFYPYFNNEKNKDHGFFFSQDGQTRFKTTAGRIHMAGAVPLWPAGGLLLWRQIR